MDPTVEEWMTEHGTEFIALVTSKEICDIADGDDWWDDGGIWDQIHERLKKQFEPIPPAVEDYIADDLYDWWKNGNFYQWAEGEVNAFGMTAESVLEM